MEPPTDEITSQESLNQIRRDMNRGNSLRQWGL